MSEDELHLYWYSIKCKKCGSVLKRKDGEALRLIDIIPFVVEHLVRCYDFFELTIKPTLEKEGES